MLIIDDINKPSENQNKVNDRQDQLIEGLQNAVNGLLSSVSDLESTVSGNKAECEGSVANLSRVTAEDLARVVQQFTLELQVLNNNLAQQFNTQKVVAVDGDINSLTTAELETSGAIIESETVENSNVKNATVENATIDTLDVTTQLSVLKAIINTLVTESLSMDNLHASEGNIEALTSAIATIDRINSKLITVSEGGTWNEPNTPDDTELLKISFPVYKGTMHVITQNDDFEITILDGTVATFRQKALYIYRIEFSSDNLLVYLSNTGHEIHYKEVFIGSKNTDTSVSEIVDKTLIEPNVNTLSGMISERKTLSLNTVLEVVKVAVLPENLIKNTIYIVRGNTAYYSDGETLTQLTNKTENFEVTNELKINKDSFLWNGEKTKIGNDTFNLDFVEV